MLQHHCIKCHLQTESLEAPHYRARVLSGQTLHRERNWIDFGDGGNVDFGDREEEEKDELEFVKESMSELESVLESVTESVEDFVEHFVESEHDYLVKEHARLRDEVCHLELETFTIYW